MTDCAILLNAVDRSAQINAVAIHVEGAELDATNFASAGWMVPISGLRSGSLQLTFNNDMTAAAIDSIMWALMFTTTTFEVRATNAVVGASNPRYHGSILVREWTPLSGSVGELAQVSVTYPLSGVLTRAIT
jgi:hypothetical protein